MKASSQIKYLRTDKPTLMYYNLLKIVAKQCLIQVSIYKVFLTHLPVSS